MPFTLAHPAAVIPLAPRVGFVSALVIGSITPDLPYFFPLGAWGAASHTALGLLLFDVPAGFISFLLFCFVLRQPLLDLLPIPAQARIRPAPKFVPLAVALALAAGAATHLVWDAFTHGSGWIVRNVPALREPLFTFGDYTVFVYKLLQHGSTAAAALLLAWWFLRWFRTTAPNVVIRPALSPARRLWIAAAILVATAVAAVTAGAPSLGAHPTVSDIQMSAGRAARAGMAALGVAILLFSLAWHLSCVRPATAPDELP